MDEWWIVNRNREAPVRTNRIATLLVTAALAGACNRPTPKADTGVADSLAVATVDGYMAAWNAHDAPAAAAFFADSGIYLDASVGTPQVGRDNAQKNVIQAFMTAAPDCKWVRDGQPIVNAAGDGVAFQWTFSGTNTGPWGDGTKASGKPFTLHGVTFLRLSSGKIQWQGDYYDALGFYKQLGMM
jgi:steroid delta-isomerase-like uncharacterized protein